MRETWVQSLGWEDPLAKGKATHSSFLAWRIPCVHGVAKSDTTERLALCLNPAPPGCRMWPRFQLGPRGGAGTSSRASNVGLKGGRTPWDWSLCFLVRLSNGASHRLSQMRLRVESPNGRKGKGRVRYWGLQREWFREVVPGLACLWPGSCNLSRAGPGSGHFVSLPGLLPTSALRGIFYSPFCSSVKTFRALQVHLSFLCPHFSVQSNPTTPFPPPRLCF